MSKEAIQYINATLAAFGPNEAISMTKETWAKLHEAMKALAEQPAQQEPVAWKLVPREPTHEMLKAMDECSTEGYDERLYAGHAASVYMAAVDAAPTPPAQRTWVGLTDEEWLSLGCKSVEEVRIGLAIQAKLKEKNNG